MTRLQHLPDPRASSRLLFEPLSCQVCQHRQHQLPCQVLWKWKRCTSTSLARMRTGARSTTCSRHRFFRDHLPISKSACIKACDAMERNPKDFTHVDWYIWYVAQELGEELFEQDLKHKPSPRQTSIKTVVKSTEDCPYSVEHAVVLKCQPSMACNPLYKAPPSNRPPVEPETAPFRTDPACRQAPPYSVLSDDDQGIAGLVAAKPGKLWSYITSSQGAQDILMTLSSTSRSQHFGATPWTQLSSTMA